MNIAHILQEVAIFAPPFLFALTVHEYAHGSLAYHFGDPTAKRLGRLTLNPLKHLDPLGVIAFFIMKIGWAKPVPVDARYFKDPVRQLLWVSLAGPGANLLTAIACGVLAKIFILLHFLLPAVLFQPLLQMLIAGVWINIMLAVFNLVPIPPLDGSKILLGLLPPAIARTYVKLEPFGFILLLVLFYTGFLPRLIMPVIQFANTVLLGK